MRLLPLLAIALFALPAAPAAAAGWSAPTTLQSRRCEIGFCSPAPAIAVSARGTVVTSYRRERDLRVLLRIGDAKGRFGAAQALPKSAYPAQLAIADDGTAVAAWARKGEIRAAFRKPGGRFGHSVLVAKTQGTEPALDETLVGLDGTGRIGVVAWTDWVRHADTTAFVRAFDAVGGRMTGAQKRLDAASFLRLGQLAVNPAGGFALAWAATEGDHSRIGVETGDRNGFAEPQQVNSEQRTDDPRVAIDPAGAVAVAYTDVHNSGDVGARGVPVLRVRSAEATAFGPELRAPADRPGRVFNPQVVFTGDGHPELLWQEKTHEAGFSRAAPLKAAIASADGTALGAPAVVAGRDIAQPRVATLAGGRLVSVWQIGEDLNAPLAGALSTDGGVFHRMRAPKGTVDPFSDASGNRALTTGGRFAAFIWGGGGKNGFVRVSVRAFG
jgi:hypothetical protein